MDQKSMDVGDECHRPSLIARYLLNRFLALLSPPTLLAFGIASINGSEGKKKAPARVWLKATQQRVPSPRGPCLFNTSSHSLYAPGQPNHVASEPIQTLHPSQAFRLQNNIFTHSS